MLILFCPGAKESTRNLPEWHFDAFCDLEKPRGTDCLVGQGPGIFIPMKNIWEQWIKSSNSCYCFFVLLPFLSFFFSRHFPSMCIWRKTQKECVDKFIDYLYLSFSIHMQTSTSLNEVCNSPSAIFHSNCVLIFIKQQIFDKYLYVWLILFVSRFHMALVSSWKDVS